MSRLSLRAFIGTVKEFRVRNLAPNAPWPDVLAPHSRWEMAKDSLELMVRVRAQVIGFPANVSKKPR
ncbi:hypothetical protein PBRA_006643 [Plasmodiophora brassicae]|uniref:Uncharacterized protein n=1 Tax=Plasmodiophora brassicae TaxID=37360 RepID=A0A0G4ITM7_PLABS|nr:hypothetical protein PBRA_006643 [Plasmodiophora brassicae]